MSLATDLRRPFRPLKRRWLAARQERALGSLRPYVDRSEAIAGWARGDEAIELALAARSLPVGATIVEIGSFLGSSAVLLAGARKVAGSGMVHCVDPFDGSGDALRTARAAWRNECRLAPVN
jgi:predicted O-methyltransferase YrrM